MRLAILALFICAGPTAICQSTPPAPVNSEKPQGLPITQPWADFNKLPPTWLSTPNTPIQPDSGVSPAWNKRQRDWKINPQQPLSGIGGKTLMAQNDHPNPQLPNAKVEPIPTRWPNAIVEPIPTQWPDSKLLPIATKSDAPVMLQAPASGDFR
jgi:hypothetical protein